MLNQLLTRRYQVISTLGEGGLGQTYVAEDLFQPSHPQCVVKLLKPGNQNASFLPIARRLFETEAEILEKLGRHPQIPQLLAHFEQKKEFIIVQEFIAGHTLSVELPLGHCWSENKVILMLKDVLQTLKFVHSYGVIHRDIKPNNLIRRDEDNKLVLIDFGAVKQVSEPQITTEAPLTPKTIAIGTQGYMPTEQARGKPRLNSDIYALGIIAIQALTGINPIDLKEDRNGEVVWRNYAKVSDKLAAVLAKMVCYHFRDRYQSASEVLEALEGIDIGSGDKENLSFENHNSTQKKAAVPETRVALAIENDRGKTSLGEVAVKSDFHEKIKPTIVEDSSASEPRIAATKVSLPNEAKIEISNETTLSKPNSKQTTKKSKLDSWNVFSKGRAIDKSSKPETTKLGNNLSTAKLSSLPSEHIKSKSVVESPRSQNIQPTISETKVSLNSLDNPKQVERNSAQGYLKETIVQPAPSRNIKPTIPETKVSLSSLNNPRKAEQSKARNYLKETRVSVDRDTHNSRLQQNNLKAKEITNKAALKETRVSLNSQTSDKSFNSAELIEKIKSQIINHNLPNLKSAIAANSQAIEEKISYWHLTASQFISRHSANKSRLLAFIPNKTPKLLLVCIGMGGVIFGSYKGYTFLQQKQFYAATQADLEEIKGYYQAKNYQLCIQSSAEFNREFSDLNQALDSFLSECYSGQLKQAEELAKESKLKDAILVASHIPADADIYTETQKLTSLWSEKIYKIANNKYQEGKLEEATAIAKAIPENIPIASKVETSIQQWNQEWQQNKTYLQTAQKKLDEKRWQEAIDTAKKISDNAYWQKESKVIVEKAEAEIAIARNKTKPRTYSTPTYRPNVSRPKPVYRPRFIPGVSNYKNLPKNPNHPINNPNRDWVKEKLGRE